MTVPNRNLDIDEKHEPGLPTLSADLNITMERRAVLLKDFLLPAVTKYRGQIITIGKIIMELNSRDELTGNEKAYLTVVFTQMAYRNTLRKMVATGNFEKFVELTLGGSL